MSMHSLDTKQSLGLATQTSISHHIKGIRPALSVMENEGFTTSECLKGSGISIEDLEHVEKGISLQQELAFYRRLLDLSQDPALGLKLGQAYRLENYGMLGYAILSSQTLGEALKTAKDFGPLSFSHFELDYTLEGDGASIIMRLNKHLDSTLMTLYEDRDCIAIINGAMLALGKSFPIKSVDLMHEQPIDISKYNKSFQCPVKFGQAQMRIHLSAETLSILMPLRDPETSQHCREQCQLLLEKISLHTSLSTQIKQILKQAHNTMPSLSELCKTLDMPERTMRRKLAEEGYKFQDLLNNVRFELAKDLFKTNLNLNEIAQRLGYSEAGNFSHAFKRWSGVSPKVFRETY